MRGAVAVAISVVSVSGCARDPLDAAAETYVELAVALDAHDPDYVDATLREVPLTPLALDSIEARARTATAGLTEDSTRSVWLKRQLESLLARAAMLRQPDALSFDDEARALLGVEPDARLTEADAAPLLATVSELLPGTAGLRERHDAFESRIAIPTGRIETVAARAIEACRARAVSKMDLPAGERVRLELVRDQPWASYHYYRGRFQSVVRVNLDARWSVPSLLDAMCHETYPGHHMMTVLIDATLVSEKKRVEHTVQVLRSPSGFALERAAVGSARLVFTTSERLDVERELTALAGLDATLAGEHGAVANAVRALEPFAVEGARRYLDGELDRVQAVLWLEKHALVSDPWGFLFFADRYRSYILAYPDRDRMLGWKRYERLVLGDE